MKDLKKKTKCSYYQQVVDWFRRGTVAEPWSTSEELFNNPEIKKEIEIAKKLFYKQTKK